MTPTLPRRHRHFIALPMVLAALIVAWGTAGERPLAGHVSASTLLTDVQTLGGSARGDLLAMDDGVIRLAATGSVLVRADGAVEVAVGWARFRVTGGIAQIHRDDDGVMILALSAPVLVMLGDQTLAVPAGMSWHWNGQPLPTLDDGLKVWWSARRPADLSETGDVARLVAAAAALPGALPLVRPVADATPWQAALTLSAARERLQEREASAALLALQDSLVLHPEEAPTALDQAIAVGAFETDIGRARLPELFDQSAVPAVTLALSERLASTPEDWFFLPLLPAAHSLALAPEPPTDTPLDLRLQQALLLPLSDRRATGLSELMIRQWNDSLLPLAQESDQPEIFQQLIAQELLAVIEQAQAKGWVERAERYRAALPTL